MSGDFGKRPRLRLDPESYRRLKLKVLGRLEMQALWPGGRDSGAAYEFMQDRAERIIGRPQITTDAHRPYLQAIEDAFGADAVYAMLHKIYGAPIPDESRYSPATCIGCDMKVVSGDPDPKHVSTSYVGRQNFTKRCA